MASKVHTHDYMAQFNMLAHGDAEFMEYYTARFEAEARDYLKGSKRDDVGAVMLYLKDGVEVAYFDYENLVGSVLALGGTSASFVPS